MPKPATGFMTNDGNFFETENEAEFHEAETELMMVLGKNALTGDVIDRFMALCVTHNNEIRRYVDAYKAINKEERVDDPSLPDSPTDALERVLSPRPTDSDIVNDEAAATIIASLQLQQAYGHGTVSDVGSGPRAEAVQDDTKGDGS